MTVIEEKVKIDGKSSLFNQNYALMNDIFSKNPYGEFVIKRNFRDDTFNVLFLNPNQGNAKQIFSVGFNANNKYMFDVSEGPLWSQLKNNYTVKELMLHHSSLDNLPFSKTNMINVDFSSVVGDLDRIPKSIRMRETLFLGHEHIKKNYILNSANDEITIRYLNEIHVKSVKPYKMKNYTHKDKMPLNPIITKNDLVIEFQYKEIVIKFLPIDNLNGSNEIAEIYFDGDNQMSDFGITLHSLETQDGKMNVYFKPDEDTSSSVGKAHRIGYLVVDAFSRYDYDKKKVVHDMGAYSKSGLLIPYNFDGIYNVKLKLSFAGLFSSLEFVVPHKHLPLLNQDRGTVKLKIEQQQDKTFEVDEIYSIESENFNSLDSALTIQGIFRRSNSSWTLKPKN